MFRKVLIAATVLILAISVSNAEAQDSPPNPAIPERQADVAYVRMVKAQEAARIKVVKEEPAVIIAKPTPEEIFANLYPGEDYNQTIVVLAKLLKGEAGGVKSDTNKACVIWCVLNRVDVKMRGDTVIECAVSVHQFSYRKRNQVKESFVKIAKDVLDRWLLEKTGETDVGRVLPKNYCYFYGNGRYNVFRNQYKIHGSKKITPKHSDVYAD